MQGQPNSVSKGETMFMSPKFSLKKDQIDWNSNALFYGKDMNFPYQKLFDTIIWRNYSPAGLLGQSRFCLEIGCGTGQFGRFFSEYVGVDFSKRMVEIALKQFREKNYICCSSNFLPFKDDGIKVVVANNVLHHFVAQGTLTESLKEIYRVCSPDGYFCFTDRLDNFLNNVLVRTFIALKLLAIRLFGYFSSCGTSNEPLFRNEHVKCVLTAFDLVAASSWRTIPTWIMTVASHVVHYVFGQEIAFSFQRISMPLINMFEKASHQKFCTETSVVTRPRKLTI